MLGEVPVPEGSAAIGRSLVELGLPTGALIVLVRRGDGVFVPRGVTQIEAQDALLVLAEPAMLHRVHEIVGAVARV